MRKKSIGLSIAAFILCVGSLGAQTKDVATTGPGSLRTLLSQEEQETLEGIAIRGSINTADIALLNAMSSRYRLKTIDLSKAEIAESSPHVYPDMKELIFPCVDWGISFEELKAREAALGGIQEGEPKEWETGEFYVGFRVTPTDKVPVRYRSYYLKPDAARSLSHSAVTYPLQIVFRNRGGGTIDFNPAFIKLLEGAGYSAPMAIPNGFVSMNADADKTLVIQIVSFKEEPDKYAQIDVLQTSATE